MKKCSLNSKFVFVLSIFTMACLATSVEGLMRVAEINESLNGLLQGAVAHQAGALAPVTHLKKAARFA